MANPINPPSQPSRVFPPGLIFGLFIALAGVLLLLDNFGLVHVGSIFRLWPLAIVAVGVTHLMQSSDAPRRIWGVLLGVIGLTLLMNNLGWFHFNFHLIWPVGLIALGGILLWRALEPSTFPLMAGAEADQLNLWTIFGGGKRRINSQNFRGGDVTAVFGGYEIDLRKASFPGDKIVVNATAVFGGLEFRIPEEWSISMESIALFGGNEDKTIQPRDGGTKRLIVKGFAVFGGISAQN